MPFHDKIRAAASRNGSRTVLALDLEDPDPSKLLSRSRNVLELVSGQICAVKVNRQLILTLGLPTVSSKIIKLADDYSLPTIMDAKLNDVGHTNEFMARAYFDAGFDAIIASPIVGWENGMDKVFELALKRQRGVLLLTYMSNPGAETFYSLKVKADGGDSIPIFEMLVRLGIEWKADGLIVGATRPEIISRVHQLAGERLPIFSPGIGAQGGDAANAARGGASYLIIGRAIYGSRDPKTASMELRIPP